MHPGDRQDGRGGSLTSDLVKGTLAGAAAGLVMDRLDWFMYEHEDPAARHRTQSVRPGGMDPAHVAVNRLAGLLGIGLSPRHPHPAGLALHFGLAIGPGAAYGVLRRHAEGLGMARGPLYGLALFLLQDEALNAVSGLSARPSQYPWQAHARGLVAHLVYGVVLDAALNVLDAMDQKVRHP
jgi:hypothetical protein